MKMLLRHFAILSLAVSACLGAPTHGTDQVEMVQSLDDFNAPAGWSDRAAPSAGKDYINNGAYHLRTPGGLAVRFPGKSLTIVGNGQSKGSRYATLMLKLNDNGVFTVDDLRLQNAVVMQGKNASPVTLEGGLTLLAGISSLRVNGGTTLNVASAVTGAGALRKDSGGSVVLLSSNDFSGGTWVDAGALRAEVAHSLGTGDVIVADDAVIELASGQAMALGASLILAPRAAATLSFSGTLAIARLSLDGGATFVEPGVWGGASSGANNVSNLLSGIGRVRVRGTAPRS